MREASLILERPVSLDRLQAHAEAGQLFAVLDSCDAEWVPTFVDGMGEEHAGSLYRGDPEETFWAVAPYLVSVDQAVLRWITEFAALQDDAWGILLVADVSLPELRRHLRSFLRVLAPDGEPMYFRFYDPRLLPAFLATCTSDELARFFGPVSAFIVPAEDDPQRFRRLYVPSGGAGRSGDRPAIRIRRIRRLG